MPEEDLKTKRRLLKFSNCCTTLVLRHTLKLQVIAFTVTAMFVVSRVWRTINHPEQHTSCLTKHNFSPLLYAKAVWRWTDGCVTNVQYGQNCFENDCL